MSKSYRKIKKGLGEAIKFMEGNLAGAKVFQPQTIDVKKLRTEIGMTQEKFALAFGISLHTLRHWERGDRSPQGPALVLLNLMAKQPDTVNRLLYQ